MALLRRVDCLVLAIVGWFAVTWTQASAASITALNQEAYVWQRAWNRATVDALAAHASNFSRLVALDAEVTWQSKQPHLTEGSLDYAALRDTRCPIGLALRIGNYPGPFTSHGEPVDSLIHLIRARLEKAASNRLVVTELELDFDCADSKLRGYRTWIEAFRRAAAPVPVVFTALPSWLKQPGFKDLALAAGSYVLQVHSLERPANADSHFSLCDPDAAQQAVSEAVRLGVPFRVALPTYGYLLAFDRQGRFIGLSAEGPSRSWPEGTLIRALRADPSKMARLVAQWTAERPEFLRGIIWYRLPVQTDVLNWPWPTLQAVMQGRPPRESLRAQATVDESGLVDVRLLNDGETAVQPPAALVVRWRAGRLIAADGLEGFTIADETGPRTLRLERRGLPSGSVVDPGDQLLAGWLRLAGTRGRPEVSVESLTNPARESGARKNANK